MDRQIEVATEIINKYGFLYRCSLTESSPTEEKVCLRFIDSKWCVYYIERGTAYDTESFDNVNDACVEIILKAILDKSMHKKAIEDYYNKLLDDKNDNIRNSTIRFLVSSEAIKAATLL